MPVYYYLWLDRDSDHVAQHGVSERDFEYVVGNARRSDETLQQNGRTRVEGDTEDGRRIRCVYEKIDALWVRPVTAHELDGE